MEHYIEVGENHYIEMIFTWIENDEKTKFAPTFTFVENIDPVFSRKSGENKPEKTIVGRIRIDFDTEIKIVSVTHI